MLWTNATLHRNTEPRPSGAFDVRTSPLQLRICVALARCQPTGWIPRIALIQLGACAHPRLHRAQQRGFDLPPLRRALMPGEDIARARIARSPLSTINPRGNFALTYLMYITSLRILTIQ